jgi:hypothetical protein
MILQNTDRVPESTAQTVLRVYLFANYSSLINLTHQYQQQKFSIEIHTPHKPTTITLHKFPQHSQMLEQIELRMLRIGTNPSWNDKVNGINKTV